MKLSARNQLSGTVSAITEGAVMAEVVITLTGGAEVVAAITRGAEHGLQLATGTAVSAVIKATDLILGIDDGSPLQVSARNQLPGTVSAITEGVVTAEVAVRLAGGEAVIAVITLGSVHALNLAVGSEVVVVIKATEVMVATHG